MTTANLYNINGNSSDYGWSLRNDGVEGIVVWKGSWWVHLPKGTDICFTDKTVDTDYLFTNRPPVLNDDFASGTVNSTVKGNVLANDTDADGNTLTALLKEPTRNGTVVLNGDGSFTYTPKAGFTGTDTFTYSALDNNGSCGCESATVTITVTGGSVNSASVGDRVWIDTNKNGLQDNGEAGASGVTVQLYDANGTVIATKVTDANGNYLFDKLAAGSYSVGVAPVDGYQATIKNANNNGSDAIDSDINANGRTDSFTLAAGEHNGTIDIGGYKTEAPPPANTASISDRVWIDSNKNGLQDAGEVGASGVTLQLLDANGNVLATQVTNANGNYLFDKLAAGNYMVQVAGGADGYQATIKNANNNGSDAIDSDINANGRTDIITLAAGEQNCDVDIGGYKTETPPPDKTASIGDKVWLDANKNGVQDNGETGVAGVTVQLKDASGNIIASQQTNSSGDYLFDKLAAGNYSVNVVKPGQYEFTSQDAFGNNADVIDSDVNSSGATGTITLKDGDAIRTVDAGLVVKEIPANSSIGDKIWLDTNKNGLQDNGEAGVAGVTMQLKDASGTVIATTTTNAQGDYLFDGLKAGDYTVKAVANGYDFTTQDAYNNGADGIDSDFNVTTGETAKITLGENQDIRTVDGGVVKKTGSIGDLVFEDMNFNGVQDAGEKGIANVKVNLTDVNGTVLKTVTTDANGNYQFTDLLAGDYKVKVEGPSGYYVTKSNIGDDAKDSDIDSNGLTGVVKLGAGENITTVDAGLYRKGVIGDHLWADTPVGNGDGIQQDNGTGSEYGGYYIPYNVTVRLYTSTGQLVATTKADHQGNYKFVDVDPGDYYVDFDNSTGTGYFTGSGAAWGAYAGVAGFVWTKKDQGGNDALDSDVTPYGPTVTFQTTTGTVTGSYMAKTDVFHLASGQIDLTRDAGLQVSPIMLDLNKDGHIGVTGQTTSIDKSGITSIGHTVSFDLDADGVKEQIEWSDGKGDGFLVDMTKIGPNGEIDGSALFGDEGGKYGNGYEKLALHDANGDGTISGSELDGFGVWIDNGDAIVQDGEIKSAADLHITSVSADMQIAYDDAGRALMQATAEVDGQTILTEDVWFAQAQAEDPVHQWAA